MNRGSSSRALWLFHRASRFNEAPIHESGKCFQGHRHHPQRRCFNEAPIHESGKYELLVVVSVQRTRLQ